MTNEERIEALEGWASRFREDGNPRGVELMELALHHTREAERQERKKVGRLHPKMQAILDQHFPNRCECSTCNCHHQLERWNYHLCDDCATDQHSERRYA